MPEAGKPRRAVVRTMGLALCLATGLLTAGCTQTAGPSATQPGAVGERVLEKGVIRAAYISYPPALMKDTRTGKVSGVFAEVLERAAANLGLKVEWTEEVGWGAQIEGLNANRYDIIGSPVWANPTRAKLTTLTRPVYYSGIGIYVRAGDNRFAPAADGSWASINSPQARIATIDGETGDLIARNQFPNAKRVTLPQNTDISQLFLELAGNKADVIFAEPYFAQQYLKTNPGKVMNLAERRPITILGNVYMLKAGETQLKQALDVTIEDLINSGYVDQLLRKYEGGDTYYHVARAYEPKP